MPQFIATIPPGFEYLLVDELKQLGATDVREGLMQVKFSADWPVVYRILLWTRLANRILYPIAEFEAADEQQLYDQVKQVEWDLHLQVSGTLAVDFVSRKSHLDHRQFGAQRVKDAVVDYFKDEYSDRPSVDTKTPDLRIHCRLNKNQATLCVDLSGSSLHQRGYRQLTGEAPLKESLAAAILYRADWFSPTNRPAWLLDPMCGSGTIAIEAALIAANIAPGLARQYWGFQGWKPFHREYWQVELESAQSQVLEPNQVPVIFASDKSGTLIDLAKQNAEQAGVADWIEFKQVEFQQVKRPAFEEPGVIVTNPPYGERLEEQAEVKTLYSELGNWLKDRFSGDTAAILSADKSHGHSLNIRAHKRYKLNNGAIPCELLKLNLIDSQYVQPRSVNQPQTIEDLHPSARMFANRLLKNNKALKSYVKQQNLDCVRLYDADLPEYAVAIDRYHDHVHVQEYAPPKTVDAERAKRRLRDIEQAIPLVLDVPRDHIHMKTRSQQKGIWQYSKADTSNKSADTFLVREGTAKFEVDLDTYLDTGLFIDHRKARALMPQWCGQGNFLNLFCYTATASVHCAMAGAKTVNVDLSNTYLDWGQRNFKHNKLSTGNHQFDRADTMGWLNENIKRFASHFDVIFIDPPTFSNSKRTSEHFDVQKDHVKLILKALKCLKPTGKLLFSNNYKKFSMDFVEDSNHSIKEITQQTTSRDFARKALHRSWLIEFKGSI